MPAQITMVLSNTTTSTSVSTPPTNPAPNMLTMGRTVNNRAQMNMFDINNNKGGCKSCGGR